MGYDSPMQIGCTKKLRDYLGVAPQPLLTSQRDFYSWSATLKHINSCRTIIVTNDSSSYGFVLYGIKKGDLKNIDDLIVEGIKSCFVSECVKPSIIERYLEECGSKPLFTKTANRKIVAHQNFFVERLYYDIDKATPSKLLQNHLALPINRQYRTYEEGHAIIRNKFHEDLKRHYGKGIYSCRVAELEIDLNIHTECRRRILVPLNFPFSYLHSVIQRLFR
jgi:hypothetical protein